jgi:hypothetical protein
MKSLYITSWRRVEYPSEKFFFRLSVVHEDDVGVAASSNTEGLAGAKCDHLYGNARPFGEARQEVAEEA